MHKLVYYDSTLISNIWQETPSVYNIKTKDCYTPTALIIHQHSTTEAGEFVI